MRRLTAYAALTGLLSIAGCNDELLPADTPPDEPPTTEVDQPGEPEVDLFTLCRSRPSDERCQAPNEDLKPVSSGVSPLTPRPPPPW